MGKGPEPLKDVATVGREIAGAILEPGNVLLDEMCGGGVGYWCGCHWLLVISCCRSPVTVAGCCRCFLTTAILPSFVWRIIHAALFLGTSEMRRRELRSGNTTPAILIPCHI
jgi:hypothetical protein